MESHEPKHEKKQRFDWLVDEATGAGLEKDIAFKETIKFQHAIDKEKGTWDILSLSEQLKGMGCYNKLNQVQKLHERFTKAWETVHSSQLITFNLKRGSRLPIPLFQRQEDEKTILDLRHNQGEILLLVVWWNWYAYEARLLEFAASMRDKVRVACLNTSLDDEQFQLIKKRYHMLEHIQLNYKIDNQRELIKVLAPEGVPSLCLVNQMGIIDYLGYPTGIDLESRVSQLINQSPTEETPVNAAIEDGDPIDRAGEQLWVKFRPVIDHFSAPKELNTFKFSYTRTRTFKDGKTTISIKDIRLSYILSEEKDDSYRELVKKMTENLKPSEYVVDVDISDTFRNREDYLNHQYDLLQDILIRNGINDKPTFKVAYYINFDRDYQWNHQNKTVCYPNIAYQGKANLSMGRKVKEDYDSRHISNNFGFDVPELQGKYPFTLVGNKFAGIYGFTDAVTGARKDIVAQEGVTQIIFFQKSNSNSYHKIRLQYIKQMSSLLDKYNAAIHLVPQRVLKQFISIAENLENDRVVAYFAETFVVQTNDTLEIFERLAEGITIIVDRFGTIVSSHDFSDLQSYEKVLQSCQKPYLPKKNVSEGFLKFLQNLPHEEAYKSVYAQLQPLNYPAVVKVTYIEESNKELKKPVGHSVQLTVKLRTCHKPIVQPLLKILEEESEIATTFMDMVELPEGTNCSDCKGELKLPYYYFHISKVHKCVNCAQRQDKTATDKLKRYPVNEHSILILSDRIVPVWMLGKNLQPSTSEECIQSNFKCSGCENSDIQDARYVCLGCKQEKVIYQVFVDFCFTCAEKLRGTDETAQQDIVLNTQYEHSLEHALLRVQYSPKGYWSY